jgi:hypothetical protein
VSGLAAGGKLMRVDGQRAIAGFFCAEQSAHVIANAERYYRSMFRGRVSSWNLRDEHMARTIQSLLVHLKSGRGKIVVCNSHLGGARATDMGQRGELNVGLLPRENSALKRTSSDLPPKKYPAAGKPTRQTAASSVSSFFVEVDELGDCVDIGAIGDAAFLFLFFQKRAGEIVPPELGSKAIPDQEVAFIQAPSVGVAPFQNLLVRAAFEDALAKDAVVDAQKIGAGSVGRPRPPEVGVIILG